MASFRRLRSKKAMARLLAVCLTVLCVSSLQLNSPHQSMVRKQIRENEPVTDTCRNVDTDENVRRKIFQSGLVLATGLGRPRQANAAKGAAEYDFEYYMRDLVGGNKREGNIQASTPPPSPPPRKLQGPLISLLLDDECTQSCVPSQALLQRMLGAPGDAAVSSSTITAKMKDFRSKVSRSFSTRSNWESEHVSDQYYFDLTSYALWRTAADIIPDYADRDTFARDVGRGIYLQAKESGLLKKTAKKEHFLTGTVLSMIEILDLFKDSKFCESYRIGSDQNDKKDQAIGFDEFDDEDLQNGASVNCLISVYSPATLGASLQITGEKSRFSPEFVGSTIAAMWESVGIKVSYETYFVDREYRPNPKDYFPDEQLLQFTLTKK